MSCSKGQLNAKVNRLRTQLTNVRRNSVHPLEQRVNRLSWYDKLASNGYIRLP